AGTHEFDLIISGALGTFAGSVGQFAAGINGDFADVNIQGLNAGFVVDFIGIEQDMVDNSMRDIYRLRISGSAIDPNVVPEPATAALSLLSLAAFALTLRHRRG